MRSDGGAELALGAAARLQWLVPAFGYATGTESPSPRGCLAADFMHAGEKIIGRKRRAHLVGLLLT